MLFLLKAKMLWRIFERLEFIIPLKIGDGIFKEGNDHKYDIYKCYDMNGGFAHAGYHHHKDKTDE